MSQDDRQETKPIWTLGASFSDLYANPFPPRDNNMVFPDDFFTPHHDLIDMDQSEIFRHELRSDLLLSTLRRFIQATGGDLHLVAHFPDGNVELLIGSEFSEDPTV